jgi:TRAP transporter TAXI family solute receptor
MVRSLKVFSAVARAGFLAALMAAPTWAADPVFLRIGTGGAGATYFPIGSLIAESVSGPSDKSSCDAPEQCGVAGLIAVPQISNGSVANVQAIGDGSLEAALAQSDIVYWAHTGTGTFAGRERISNLRFVANLYPESVHLVVRTGLGITSVADLRGHRISLDEPGSGTLVNARAILHGFGLSEGDIKAEYVKPDLAIERMRAGRLDGFFIVAGWPIKAVHDFVAQGDATLVPIAGPEVEVIRRDSPFLMAGLIPAGTYPGVSQRATLNVNAHLIVAAKLDEELVYKFVSALWSERSMRHLREGHPRGALIARARALSGASIPLHPGAERYYREIGLIR